MTICLTVERNGSVRATNQGCHHDKPTIGRFQRHAAAKQMNSLESSLCTRRELLQSGTAIAVNAWVPWSASQSEGRAFTRRAIRMTENLWITVRDGTRLACRLWVPEGADADPVGVVLEALPYSKRDGTRAADNEWASLFTPYGFAYVRLDLRGTGESEGLLADEYLAQEQQDIVDVIAWLARQHWCNGSVGMRGYSWGGFNSLQVAMLNPPELKAIVTACSSYDRYLDDAHYVGGVPSLSNLQWGAYFRNVLTDAPDPAIVGTKWREMWLQRLRAAPPIVARWLDHALNDPYWRHGSVSADYGAIKCGVFAVGGQTDAYSQSIPHLLERLSAPRIGLIGSWGHGFPHHAAPGPGLDWVIEEVRWWAYWLHGEETGIMQEPVLRAYIGERAPGAVWPADVPGRWVAEERWPSTHVQDRTWHLNSDGLETAPGEKSERSIAPHQALGITRSEWLPLDPSTGLPAEQSRDDALALVFDSEPLGHDMDMLGLGSLTLRIASDRPMAKVVARINEVAPDGSSWPVVYGVLNLTHRDSHEEPALLEPGQPYDVTVPLTYGAYRFKRGHRLRVALSESLWPLLTPSPEPVTLTVTTGVSALTLPIRPMPAEKKTGSLPPILRDRNMPAGTVPSPAAAPALVQIKPDPNGEVRIVRFDPPLKDHLVDIHTDRTVETGIELSISDTDPTSSTWRIRFSQGSSRSDWDFRTSCTAELRLTREQFIVKETIQAFERGNSIFDASVESVIQRRFV